MGTQHELSVGSNNHAFTANPNATGAPYANLTERNSDTAFHSNAANINKVVRVDSPLSYYILTSITPTWEGLGASLNDTFLELTDVPNSYVGESGKVPQVNVGETAIEFIDLGALIGATVSGTPVDNQIAVWINASTIEGTSGLTYDGSTFAVTGAITATDVVVGAMMAAGNSTTTTIATQNTWTDLNLNAIAASSSNNSGWTLTNTTTGEQRYDNATAIKPTLIASVSGESSGAPQEFEFRVIVNGSPTSDAIIASSDFGAGALSIILQAGLSLSQNDLVRIQVQNIDGVSNITIKNISVQVKI